MIKYGIYEDIGGEDYKRLIDYLFKRSDAFMLVYFRYTRNESIKALTKKIKTALAPFRIKIRHNPVWPTTISSDKHYHDIIVYRSAPETRQYLDLVDHIFGWEYYNPIDLCFFKDGYCMFSVTAHEEFATIYFKDDEDISEIFDLIEKYAKKEKFKEEWFFYEDYQISN